MYSLLNKFFAMKYVKNRKAFNFLNETLFNFMNFTILEPLHCFEAGHQRLK